MLIDTDPHGSLSAWWNSRAADTPTLASASISELPAKLAALADAGFAYAVIDTPPAITASICAVIGTADLVSSRLDQPARSRAVGSTVDLAHEAERPFVFAVTQAKENARLTTQAVTALSQHGAMAGSIVHHRVDYASSVIDGRAVIETDPKGRSSIDKANCQIR